MTASRQSERSFGGRALRLGLVWSCALQAGPLGSGGCSSERPAPTAPRIAMPSSGQAGESLGGNGVGGGSVAGEGGRAGDSGGAERAGGAAGEDSSGGERSVPGAGGEAGQDSGGAASTDPPTEPDPFPCASDAAAPPAFDAVCSLDGEWAAGVAASFVTVGPNASLLGVTPDELTLVWLEPESSQVVYFVADRSSADAAFGQAQRLEGESVFAVSPDGLRLVVLSDDAGALLERTRVDRSQAFGDRSEGDFALLNADAQANGYGFSSCVFSPDGLGLFYTVGGVDERYPLRESRRTQAGPWPIGVGLETCELEAHAGFGRYPTGASSDGKTLFFYDAWRGVARAAWRETNDAPFSWFRDLGNRRSAQVNSACDRLYYSSSAAVAPLVVAPAQ